MEIDYYSFGRDALTTRAIDPFAVFHAYGHWYTEAWCHLVDADRLFRVDRIQGVRPTGERFEPRRDDADAVVDTVYHPSPDDPRVTIELSPDAGWVVESYPCEEVEERPDGSWRVVLAVSERAWLERLLLRLGRDGRVLAPPEFTRAAADAAARLLRRISPTWEDDAGGVPPVTGTRPVSDGAHRRSRPTTTVSARAQPTPPAPDGSAGRRRTASSAANAPAKSSSSGCSSSAARCSSRS